MPATLDISCPKCGKALKVPTQLEGKKIRCKECQQVFQVSAGKAAAATPPAPEKPKNPFLDDDEDLAPGQAPKPMGVVQESDVARCPHCAKELDPPDAVVCVNCGFNNVTRVKANIKKVVAPEATDWINHLGPAIIALILAIGLIVVDIICIVNMSDWMAGSALEMEEKNPVTGKTQYYVMPGAFTAMIIAASVVVIIPAARFAIRRLAFDYKPEEKVKK